MNEAIVISVFIFCTLGWAPILAIGKAVAMVVRELRCNYNDSDVDIDNEN